MSLFRKLPMPPQCKALLGSLLAGTAQAQDYGPKVALAQAPTIIAAAEAGLAGQE